VDYVVGRLAGLSVGPVAAQVRGSLARRLRITCGSRAGITMLKRASRTTTSETMSRRPESTWRVTLARNVQIVRPEKKGRRTGSSELQKADEGRPLDAADGDFDLGVRRLGLITIGGCLPRVRIPPATRAMLFSLSAWRKPSDDHLMERFSCRSSRGCRPFAGQSALRPGRRQCRHG
jgi:hypothetical protein